MDPLEKPGFASIPLRALSLGWGANLGIARRSQVRILSAFYAATGVLALLSVLLPEWPARDGVRILGAAAVAGLVSGLLYVAGSNVSRALCNISVAFASFLVGYMMMAAGGGAGSAAYGSFFMWIAVYAFVFFSAPAATLHVILAIVLQGTAVTLLDDGSGASAQLLVSSGMLLVTGLVVGRFTSYVRSLAGLDALTKLPNRRSLEVTTDNMIAASRRSGLPLSLLVLDLSGFRALNSSVGHSQGDAALVEVARAWSDQLRASDYLARLGGDEFAVLLPNCPPDQALLVAHRIVAATPAPLTAAGGSALARTTTSTLESGDALLARAEEALRSAKAVGPGTVHSAEPGVRFLSEVPAPSSRLGAPEQLGK